MRWSRGYNDKDTFVVKRKENIFRLEKHYALIGRTDGYAIDCLYCQYQTNENGYVTVKYRFGKRSLYLVPFVIAFTVGILLWSALLYEAIAFANAQWDAIFVATLFWLLGLGGNLIRSKKERRALESHLLRICAVKRADNDKNS